MHTCWYQLTYVRNTLENKTYASPFTVVWPFEDGNTLSRTANNEDIMATRATIQQIAEGQPWRQTVDGIRLPAAMFKSRYSVFKAEELVHLTVDAWKEKNPKRSCTLWLNERQTGMRSLGPAVYDGLTAIPSLREATPIGWERDGTDLYPAQH